MYLQIRNWQCHEKLDLELDGTTMILAENGAGKTALRDAIEFVFLGTCELRGYWTKKELGAYAIADNASETVVVLRGGVLEIQRTMNRRGEQTLSYTEVETGEDHGGSLRKIQAELLERLGLDPARIRTCLDAFRFFHVEEKERRAMLFGAAGEEFTAAEVAETLRERFEIDAGDAETLASKAATEGFRKAEEFAAEKRREAKRALDELQARSAHAERHFKVSWASEPIDLARTTVEEARKHLESRRAALEDARRSKAVDLATLRGRLEALLGRNERLCAKGQELDDAEDKEIEQVRTQLTDVRERLADATQQLASAQEHLEALEAPDEDLPQVPQVPQAIAHCPHFGSEFPCPAEQAELDAYFGGEAPEAQETPQEQVEAAAADVERLGHQHGELAQMAASLGDRIQAESNRLLSLANTNDELARLEPQIQEVETEIAKANEALGDAPNVAFLEESVRRGEKIVTAREIYERATQENEGHDERRAEIQEEQKRWDAMAQALKPTGVETILLQRLEATIAGALAEIAPLVGEVRMTADSTLEMAMDGTWRRYPQLSTGWRLRLGIAVQHLLCRLAGFPLLILDSLDWLDYAARGQVVGQLTELEKFYPVILGLAALGTDEPSAIPNVRTLRIREAALEVL